MKCAQLVTNILRRMFHYRSASFILATLGKYEGKRTNFPRLVIIGVKAVTRIPVFYMTIYGLLLYQVSQPEKLHIRTLFIQADDTTHRQSEPSLGDQAMLLHLITRRVVLFRLFDVDVVLTSQQQESYSYLP